LVSDDGGVTQSSDVLVATSVDVDDDDDDAIAEGSCLASGADLIDGDNDDDALVDDEGFEKEEEDEG
jgi:hypothetical protein